jgi:hypothetical protein
MKAPLPEQSLVVGRRRAYCSPGQRPLFWSKHIVDGGSSFFAALELLRMAWNSTR